MKRVYRVAGLTGPACGALIEKHLRGMDGISGVKIDIVTGRLKLNLNETLVSDTDVISEIATLGYIARIDENPQGTKKKRYVADLVHLCFIWLFTLAILLLSILPLFRLILPPVLGNLLPAGIIQLLLCVPVLILSRDIFFGGISAIKSRSVSMFTLASLGSIGAFLYSCLALIVLAAKLSAGESITSDLCFDIAALIPAMVELGQYLELKTRGHTSDALQKLMRMSPQTAHREENGVDNNVLASDLQKGDLIKVYRGETVPCDGTVVSGSAMIDESIFTGASQPQSVYAGDSLSGGVILLSGEVEMRCDSPLDDMRLTRILSQAQEASGTSVPGVRRTALALRIFSPLVILVALVAGVFWGIQGEGVAFAVKTAVCVLVISCPCALGFAAPVAIMAGTGKSAEEGILIKNAAALELLGGIDTVVFHAPGTLTQNCMRVKGVVLSDGVSEKQLIACAASALQNNLTPAAEALVKAAGEMELPLDPVLECEVESGLNQRALIGDTRILTGSLEYMEKNAQAVEGWKERQAELVQDGCLPLYVVEAGKILGFIALKDELRPESVQAVERLHAQGLDVMLLSDANEAAALAQARQSGVDEANVRSNLDESVLEMTLRLLKADGKKVLSVFNGSTYAALFGKSTLTMCTGVNGDLMVEAAQVLALRTDMRLVARAAELGRKTRRIARQNLFWALFYNVIAIPLAAGLAYMITGHQFSPLLAAPLTLAAGLCITANALRLRAKSDSDKTKKAIKLPRRK